MEKKSTSAAADLVVFYRDIAGADAVQGAVPAQSAPGTNRYGYTGKGLSPGDGERIGGGWTERTVGVSKKDSGGAAAGNNLLAVNRQQKGHVFGAA
jgi:hypothetical protein